MILKGIELENEMKSIEIFIDIPSRQFWLSYLSTTDSHNVQPITMKYFQTKNIFNS